VNDLNKTSLPDFTYSTRRSKRAKKIRLVVQGDGAVYVVAPYRLGVRWVDRFIATKKKWILSKLKSLKKQVVTSSSHYSRTDYVMYKEAARKLVNERLQYFNSVYGYRFNRVSIKNQKTRWGSCSSNGNLNFNYKILFLPEKIRDYIIVHELCHLQELNHSKDFWNLVSVAFPDYKQVKNDLRKYSMSLQ